MVCAATSSFPVACHGHGMFSLVCMLQLDSQRLCAVLEVHFIVSCRVGEVARNGSRTAVALGGTFGKAFSGIGGGSRGGRGRSSRGRGRGGGSRTVSQADLDKDLATYMED